MPVTAPDLKATSRPPPRDWVAAWAVRTLARTDTFMPMKPAMPGQDRADGEADGDPDAEEVGDDDEEDDTDDRDREVLPAEIGLCAFGDRAGDFLHALGAGVPLHHVVDGPEAIGDRKQAAQDN